ncbi:vesicle associated protein [Dorcoceras hygrometricum]|uniref:Vesicle associated protein n=1 Tax=Dorcoceras hygrometricum TaxID=472368 RepID=A0A2Z7BXA2_9LAMI|nr:vesicle associated protein [Dorcoceras hygrometricum]
MLQNDTVPICLNDAVATISRQQLSPQNSYLLVARKLNQTTSFYIRKQICQLLISNTNLQNAAFSLNQTTPLLNALAIARLLISSNQFNANATSSNGYVTPTSSYLTTALANAARTLWERPAHPARTVRVYEQTVCTQASAGDARTCRPTSLSMSRRGRYPGMHVAQGDARACRPPCVGWTRSMPAPCARTPRTGMRTECSTRVAPGAPPMSLCRVGAAAAEFVS